MWGATHCEHERLRQGGARDHVTGESISRYLHAQLNPFGDGGQPRHKRQGTRKAVDEKEQQRIVSPTMRLFVGNGRTQRIGRGRRHQSACHINRRTP